MSDPLPKAIGAVEAIRANTASAEYRTVRAKYRTQHDPI